MTTSKNTISPLGWIIYFWALAGLLLLVFTAILYVKWPGFGEQGEVNFATVSWLLYQGYPLYVPLDDAYRYSLQHGPNIYIFNGALMKLLGPSYLTAKLAGISSLLLSMVLTWLWLTQSISKKAAIILIGIEAWILLHWHYAIASRPDAAMLLCTTAGIYFATAKLTKKATILGLALFLGIIINLKIHGIIYFIPIFILASTKLRRKDYMGIGLIVAVLSLLPYISSYISLTNYLLWIKASLSEETRSVAETAKNFIPKIFFIMLLIVSIVALARILQVDLKRYYDANRGFIVSAFFTISLAAIIGAKPGSGTNHLMPTIPLYIYILKGLFEYRAKNAIIPAPQNNSRRKPAYILIGLLVLISTISGINREKILLNLMRCNDKTPILQELAFFEDKYKGMTIEVGYGQSKSAAMYRDFVPVPVFHGNPLLVESVALQDMNGVSPATIKKIEDGLIQVWLLPVANNPFELKTFSSEFREAFEANYQLETSGKYFDVWVYKKKADH